MMQNVQKQRSRQCVSLVPSPDKDGEATQAEIDMLTGHFLLPSNLQNVQIQGWKALPLGPGLSKKYTSQLSDRGAKMKWQLGHRETGGTWWNSLG